MGRIMATAVLATALFAACGDDDATGPTADGGEIVLELFKHREDVSKSTGEGYWFASGEKTTITMAQALKGEAGKLSDIDGFPEVIGSAEYAMWAIPHRIYIGVGRANFLQLHFKETAEFELVTLDGKARYKIAVEHHKVGFDERRNGTVSEFVMRYKLLGS